MIEALMSAGLFVWLLIGIETILLLYWIDREYSGLATISIIISAALLQWACGINIIGYVAANPAAIGYAIGGYFVLGTVWAVIKWWFYVRAMRRKYDEFKRVFLKSHEIEGNVIPDNLKERWAEDLRGCSYGDDKIEVRPEVTNHKARIYLWMAYWPWSCVWTVINDPIKRVFTEIYAQIRATLQRISDHVWAGTEGDLPSRKKK